MDRVQESEDVEEQACSRMVFREEEGNAAIDPLNIADSDWAAFVRGFSIPGALHVSRLNVVILLFDEKDDLALDTSEADGHFVDADCGVGVSGGSGNRAFF